MDQNFSESDHNGSVARNMKRQSQQRAPFGRQGERDWQGLGVHRDVVAGPPLAIEDPLPRLAMIQLLTDEIAAPDRRRLKHQE